MSMLSLRTSPMALRAATAMYSGQCFVVCTIWLLITSHGVLQMHMGLVAVHDVFHRKCAFY